MSNPGPEPGEVSERFDQSKARRVRSRADRVRRALRYIAVLGFLFFVVGAGIGLSAAGPSVPATVLVLTGLLLSVVSLVAHRFVFWSQVLSKDRGEQQRGPGP